MFMNKCLNCHKNSVDIFCDDKCKNEFDIKVGAYDSDPFFDRNHTQSRKKIK
jgi:hypothetical protein